MGARPHLVGGLVISSFSSLQLRVDVLKIRSRWYTPRLITSLLPDNTVYFLVSKLEMYPGSVRIKREAGSRSALKGIRMRNTDTKSWNVPDPVDPKIHWPPGSGSVSVSGSLYFIWDLKKFQKKSSILKNLMIFSFCQLVFSSRIRIRIRSGS